MRKFVKYVRTQAAVRGMGIHISGGGGPVRYRFETPNGARDIGPVLHGQHEVEVFLAGWDACVEEQLRNRKRKE